MKKSKRPGQKSENQRALPQEIFICESQFAKTVRADKEKRWKVDRVADLPEGFTLVPTGRAATIYLREEQRLCEFDAELAGDPAIDVLIFVSSELEWLDLRNRASTRVEHEEQRRIRDALEGWLRGKGIRYSIS